MHILLTGGTGFIGFPVRNYIASHGLDFHFTTFRAPFASPTGGEPIQCDLLTEEGRIRAVEAAQADTLIHLAWYAEPSKFWISPTNLDWVVATLDLVRRFVLAGGKRCVVAGTCAEYDWTGGGRFSEDLTPARPATFYGKSKDALRRVLMDYAKLTDLSMLWCRLFWPYGPGEPEGRLFSSLIKDLGNDKTAVCRAGNLKRDYMHVDDIAKALVAASVSDSEGIMNIASGKATSLGYLASVLAEALGKSHLLEVGNIEAGPESPEEIYADITRLNQVCPIETISFEEGIHSWLKNNQRP